MTNSPDLAGIHSDAALRIRPFFEALLETGTEAIHSLHVVGSAVSGDYDTSRSDVNSVLILQKMDLAFLELMAPLGKTFLKKRVRAPLIMTPEYIRTSLDVFPIEFREMAQIHKTAHGEDILAGLQVDRRHLRHQCERDLKARLVGLRQGYLSSMGDAKVLSEDFARALSGYAPLFRAILALYEDDAPPFRFHELLPRLEKATGVDVSVYRRALDLRKDHDRLSIEELNRLFEDYYVATDRLSHLIDGLVI